VSFRSWYVLILFCSVAKHLESANTMFTFILWIIGFYWVSVGGQVLTRDAPQLYWYIYSVKFASHFCLSLFVHYNTDYL
jgi:hypothetical protein